MKQAIQQIPLSKLVASDANVRRTNGKDGIKQLAASILAHGLMQNLTVKPSGKRFEVIAGGRRLSALLILAGRKELPKNAPIPCRVIDDNDNATELSLAENVGQAPMHPADQYEAFAALHVKEGMSAEDIASRFGVTVALVKQRLSLGAISPKLIKLYRSGDMNLDQLTAFTITDDHEKQERVWKEMPHFNRSRSAILHALSEGQVPSDDRRALFVGSKAYQKAGGTIIRDLFDAEGAGYFNEADLLNRLVREKLQQFAAPVLAEGWKWVAIEPAFDFELTATMRRVRPQPVRLSDEDQAKLDALEAEHDELAYAEDDEDVSAAIERIERDIAAITGESVFAPSDIVAAGAFVSLGSDGLPEIQRGFIRPEDNKLATEIGGEGARPAQPDAGGDKPLSAALIAELTATRTLFLREALSRKPDVALQAVTHALALEAFLPHANASCLEISVRSASLMVHASGIDETAEAKSMRGGLDAWAQQLPLEASELWDFIVKLDQKSCLNLLARCAAQSLNALRLPHAQETDVWTHADQIASAVGLDLTKRWEPTAANYLGRVSKERVLEAVREGASEQDAARISGMKKPDMAVAAERLLAGKGWLPSILRG